MLWQRESRADITKQCTVLRSRIPVRRLTTKVLRTCVCAFLLGVSGYVNKVGLRRSLVAFKLVGYRVRGWAVELSDAGILFTMRGALRGVAHTIVSGTGVDSGAALGLGLSICEGLKDERKGEEGDHEYVLSEA